MANSIPTGSFSPSLYPAQPRVSRSAAVETLEGEVQRSSAGANQSREREAPALPTPDQVRKIEAQAEARSVVLQRFRAPDELPKLSQDALAAYRNTMAASMPGQGGDLARLDLYV